MKSSLVVTLVALLVVAAGLQGYPSEAVVLEDLELMDWRELPEATTWFSGGVAAAVLVGWYADHGYPEMIADWTDDGRVDWDDLCWLASDFGKRMGAQLEPIVDPHLVDVLARHIAGCCPDQFLLRIHDSSFWEEYQAHMAKRFDPASYRGIEVEIADDPSYDDIVCHLLAQRPAIAGIGSEQDDNRFAVIRSFGSGETWSGWPVGLVNTEPERFGEDAIWDTEVRQKDGKWGFPCPAWTAFETMIVLIPLGSGPTGGAASGGEETGRSADAGGTQGTASAPTGDGLGKQDDPASDRSADLEIEMKFDTAVTVGTRTRYLLYLWNNGPDTAQNISVRAERSPDVKYIDSAPIADSGSVLASPGRTVTTWQMAEFAVTPADVVGYLGAEVNALYVEFDASLCGQTVEFEYEITSDTPDPNLMNNSGVLQVPVLPCDPDPRSEEGEKPNLWVTNVHGCYTFLAQQERYRAKVSGIVHNGGKAKAAHVWAQVSACGKTEQVFVGTIPAGGEKRISATINVGYREGWPWKICITADPHRHIQEADESNNTSCSSIPMRSECP